VCPDLPTVPTDAAVQSDTALIDISTGQPPSHLHRPVPPSLALRLVSCSAPRVFDSRPVPFRRILLIAESVCTRHVSSSSVPIIGQPPFSIYRQLGILLTGWPRHPNHRHPAPTASRVVPMDHSYLVVLRTPGHPPEFSLPLLVLLLPDFRSSLASGTQSDWLRPWDSHQGLVRWHPPKSALPLDWHAV